MNNIYTKSFRNAIGIGARAFRSDYEGGSFMKGGVRTGGPNRRLPPSKKTPPTMSNYKGGGWGGFLIRGGEIMPYAICYVLYAMCYVLDAIRYMLYAILYTILCYTILRVATRTPGTPRAARLRKRVAASGLPKDPCPRVGGERLPSTVTCVHASDADSYHKCSQSGDAAEAGRSRRTGRSRALAGAPAFSHRSRFPGVQKTTGGWPTSPRRGVS